MTEVTKLLDQISQGDSNATDKLLPLVYEELRKLARSRLANEGSAITIHPTELVHEAYLRLVRPTCSLTPGSERDDVTGWNGRGHFFAAAAEAMRRILVELARRKKSQKRGGQFDRVPMSDCEQISHSSNSNHVDIVELDEALSQLATIDAQAAQVVEMRYFAGMSVEETADALQISNRTVTRNWNYARAWLRRRLEKN